MPIGCECSKECSLLPFCPLMFNVFPDTFGSFFKVILWYAFLCRRLAFALGRRGCLGVLGAAQYYSSGLEDPRPLSSVALCSHAVGLVASAVYHVHVIIAVLMLLCVDLWNKCLSSSGPYPVFSQSVIHPIWYYMHLLNFDPSFWSVIYTFGDYYVPWRSEQFNYLSVHLKWCQLCT